MIALDQLARALDPKAKRAGNGSWSCRCPAHEDKHASLSLSMKDGRLLWRCHSGCNQEEVQAELQKRGLIGKPNGADHTASPRAKADQADDWRPIMPVPDGTAKPAFTHPAYGKPTRTWTYRDAEGRLLFHVARFDPPGERKEILPRCWGTWNGRTGWYWRHPAPPRPLYQLDRLAAHPADPVLVVEGEKTADAAAEILPGYVVITWPGGSSATGHVDWSLLRGRVVTIWPDHDEPGRKAAEGIGDALLEIAAEVRIVDPPADLPVNWDLADAHPDDLDVRDLIDRAERHVDRLERLVEEAETDPGAPFESEAVDFLAAVRNRDKAEYERTRARLKKAGVRIGALDQEVERRKPAVGDDGPGKGKPLYLPEVEPWGEPVAGAELIFDLVKTLRNYVVFDQHKALATALWSIHAHCIEWAYVAPRLHITSPVPECGKTTVLEAVGRLVPRPLLTSNVSPASLFRTIEVSRPTMLVDEFDAFGTEDEQLRGLINSGHTRTSAFVIRVVDIGGDLQPRRFSTWGAICVAGIGKIPATIASRSIVIEVQRKLAGERVERLNHRSGRDLDRLGRRIARWVADNRRAIENASPLIPEQLGNRTADNWGELLGLAEVAGDPWPERAREAALALTRTDPDSETYGIQLLADAKVVFDSSKAESIWTEDLLRHLHAMSEAPWGEYGRSRRPITPRQLASLLKPFGIISRQIWEPEAKANKHGYDRDQFSAAFERYLSANPLEAADAAAFSDFPSASDDQPLADENPPKSAETTSSSPLADGNGSRAGKEEKDTGIAWQEDPARPDYDAVGEAVARRRVEGAQWSMAGDGGGRGPMGFRRSRAASVSAQSSSRRGDQGPSAARARWLGTCAHCGEPIPAGSGYTASSSGEVLHNRCVDEWIRS